MKNVMIVEDQKMVRTLFESFIEKANGYHVVASLSSAYDSIEYCRNHEIDLILMDVQTDNRENGIVAVEKIKSDYPRIKIIVVTSLVIMKYYMQPNELKLTAYGIKMVMKKH